MEGREGSFAKGESAQQLLTKADCGTRDWLCCARVREGDLLKCLRSSFRE